MPATNIYVNGAGVSGGGSSYGSLLALGGVVAVGGVGLYFYMKKKAGTKTGINALEGDGPLTKERCDQFYSAANDINGDGSFLDGLKGGFGFFFKHPEKAVKGLFHPALDEKQQKECGCIYATGKSCEDADAAAAAAKERQRRCHSAATALYNVDQKALRQTANLVVPADKKLLALNYTDKVVAGLPNRYPRCGEVTQAVKATLSQIVDEEKERLKREAARKAGCDKNLEQAKAKILATAKQGGNRQWFFSTVSKTLTGVYYEGAYLHCDGRNKELTSYINAVADQYFPQCSLSADDRNTLYDRLHRKVGAAGLDAPTAAVHFKKTQPWRGCIPEQDIDSEANAAVMRASNKLVECTTKTAQYKPVIQNLVAANKIADARRYAAEVDSCRADGQATDYFNQAVLYRQKLQQAGQKAKIDAQSKAKVASHTKDMDGLVKQGIYEKKVNSDGTVAYGLTAKGTLVDYYEKYLQDLSTQLQKGNYKAIHNPRDMSYLYPQLQK